MTTLSFVIGVDVDHAAPSSSAGSRSAADLFCRIYNTRAQCREPTQAGHFPAKWLSTIEQLLAPPHVSLQLSVLNKPFSRRSPRSPLIGLQQQASSPDPFSENTREDTRDSRRGGETTIQWASQEG